MVLVLQIRSCPFLNFCIYTLAKVTKCSVCEETSKRLKHLTFRQERLPAASLDSQVADLSNEPFTGQKPFVQSAHNY